MSRSHLAYEENNAHRQATVLYHIQYKTVLCTTQIVIIITSIGPALLSSGLYGGTNKKPKRAVNTDVPLCTTTAHEQDKESMIADSVRNW